MSDSFKVSQCCFSVHHIIPKAFKLFVRVTYAFSIIKSNELRTLMLGYSNYLCLQHVTVKLGQFH